ncbi:unnamed protein product, partial [Prorocentrum cordatum]
VPFAKCKDATSLVCSAFMGESFECPSSVRDAVQKLHLLRELPAPTLSKNAHSNLKRAREDVQDQSSLANLLVQFPLHGKLFIEGADKRVKMFDELETDLGSLRNVRERISKSLVGFDSHPGQGLLDAHRVYIDGGGDAGTRFEAVSKALQ